MERKIEVAIAKKKKKKKFKKKKKKTPKKQLPSDPRIKITLLLYYIPLVAK